MEKQFRYPGTRPFLENDRNLFFGRSIDIKNLSEMIVLEKMVVLFSKSGYGKSSLLNAGVIPQLTEKEKFQVLNIRLNELVKNPVDLVRHHLSKKADVKNFLSSKFNIPEELPNDPTAILWYFAKSIQLADKTSKALVLVFDQFEELSNFSNSEIEDFGDTLAKLLNLNLPESVRMLLRKKMEARKGYFSDEETDQLLESLNLKVVFSLRNDRISLLHRLKGSLPAILKKTSELQPLDEFQALEALLEPAEKPGDFASPEFTYTEDAIALILNSLKDQENQRIETFQLQLICQHAEELIIAKEGPKTKRLELSAAELGNPEDIFENHYNTIISSLPSSSQLKARILIEDKLIIGGNRVPLPESVIIKEHQVSTGLLKILVDKRLLRSETNTVGGMSFELSHDTLVAPIQKTARIRRIKEAEERVEKNQLEKAKIQGKLRRTRILLVTAVFALFAAVFTMLYAFNQKTIAEEAKGKFQIQAATSKALFLAAKVKDLLSKGKNFLALRVSEAAYYTALEANPHPPTLILAAISDAFYSSENLQISYFEGHRRTVGSVAFSPDGKYILTGSDDNIAILWDTNGNQIQKFEGHLDDIYSIAFSPDGNSLITGSYDQTAILWNIQGNQIHKFTGHRNIVASVDFSPNGKFLLTGSSDSTAILWDTHGKQIQKLLGHQSHVTSVTFSPDGNTLLTGSQDSTAILWNTQGKQIRKFKGHLGLVTSVAFSPDGNSFLTGSKDNTAILWNINGKPIQKFVGHKKTINSVAFSPDGNSILTGSIDSTAVIWNIQGTPIRKFVGHQNGVTSSVFSPDGKSILTGSYDNTAILWDIHDNHNKNLIKHPSGVSSATFSSDGNLFLTGCRDGTATLWDVKGNQLQKFVGHKDWINSVDFSPNGKYLLTGSYDSIAILWDVKGKIIQKLIGHSGSVMSVTFSPDGKYLFTGSEDKTVILWDMFGNQIRKFEGHSGSINSVSFSPDGKSLLTGGQNGIAILWDTLGNQIRKFEGHAGIVNSVTFSPDGKYVLTGSQDRTAILWDIQGEIIHVLEGHQNSVFSVAFSADGKFLLTGGADNIAILWDTLGNQIHKYEGHQSYILSVAFSPDGNSILTGSRDNTSILWETPQSIFNWLQSPKCPLRQLTEEEKVLYGIIEGKD
jgi:WD40 repeat protein